ncbi:MAG TPA: oligosaccharide flippase family protein [Novosphingobium sp.]|nr:oligosaccharide flippase family protein [Novosphingobium sp.]
MSAARPQDAEKPPLARIFANMAWLLGGKGFGAICGIAYLAILTRSLGLKDFGHFSLIFGTAQALIAIAGFQTWRVVVRYGSEHVHRQDWDRFGRLGMLCGLIDAIGAVVGCLLAGGIIFGFSRVLDLNPDYIDMAFWFCVAMVWALVSAPTGIVRALHRFDMAVYVEALVPILRLAAAIGIWWTGPSVARFLIAWAAIDLIEAAAYWLMARKLCPQAVRLSNLKRWREALAENPGVERFFLVTYMGATLDAVMRYGPLLAVGGLVGTRSAGLYRLAAQLTQSMSKMSTLLTRAVYAEVARVRVASATAEFRKLAVQTSLGAGIAGAVVVGIALLAGRQLLTLIGGEEFQDGAVILVPLAVAASFELASVAFEPVLHSTGRARLSLIARLLAVAGLGLGILALKGFGAIGIAWAVAIGGAVGYVAMGLMAYATLRRIEHEDEPSTAA